MAQNWTDDTYDPSHEGATDLQNIENNFGCLKSSFSGPSAPPNAVAGTLWLDTTNYILKLYTGTTWHEIWDYANARLAGTGAVGTSSVIADGVVTNTKLAANSVDGSKLADSAVSTSAKLADGVVTAAKFADHSVSPDKLGQYVCSVWCMNDQNFEAAPDGYWHPTGNVPIFVPSDCTYLVGRFYIAGGNPAYVKFLVDSYESSTSSVTNGWVNCTMTINSALKNNGWHELHIEVKASGSTATLHHWNIVWA